MRVQRDFVPQWLLQRQHLRDDTELVHVWSGRPLQNLQPRTALQRHRLRVRWAVLPKRLLRRQRRVQDHQSDDLWKRRITVHVVHLDPAVRPRGWAVHLQSDIMSERVLQRKYLCAVRQPERHPMRGWRGPLRGLHERQNL
jgi:hypothetical protein